MTTLNLGSPYSLPHLSLSSLAVSTRSFSKSHTRSFSFEKLRARVSYSGEPTNYVAAEASEPPLLDDELLSRVSAAKDADVALEIITEGSGGGGGGVVSSSDCCMIISAAMDRGNVDLALSVSSAMRFSFDPGATGGETAPISQRWRWSRPDIEAYTLLVLGLAASLRVSDALKMIGTVSRVGVSPGEEVPFGKVIRCPTCMIAIAVAQPQHGIQNVSCSKCRYQYELVSGSIVSIESEEIRIPYCRTQPGGTCMEKSSEFCA